MDTSIHYDQYTDTDHGLKFIPQRGLYGKVVYILYSVLVLLLLILLLITGLKFSQLNQDLSEVKLSIVTLDNSVKERQAASHNSGSTEKIVYDYDESPERGPERGRCDEGWTHHRTSCYFASRLEVNWHEAEDICLEHEAHLAVLNTADKLDYISKLLNDGQLYWIGLVERDTEGNWSWVDGTDYKTSDKFWDSGQPDNWDHRVDGEDCGQIHDLNYRQKFRLWNDADCTLNYRYICEKPKP